MIKVLLVDDHDLVRAGIKTLLETSGDIDIVGEANCGDAAIQYIKKSPCDIVVLDLRMPGMPIEQVISELLAVKPDLRIIALTAFSKEAVPSRLLNLGVFGFVTKACDTEHLLHAIQKVAKGERYVSPDIAKMLAYQVLNKAKYKPEDSPFEQLSKREMECLALIAQGKTTEQIANALGIQAKTINTYRHRIFQKLNIQSDIELITLAARYQILEKNRTMD